MANLMVREIGAMVRAVVEIAGHDRVQLMRMAVPPPVSLPHGKTAGRAKNPPPPTHIPHLRDLISLTAKILIANQKMVMSTKTAISKNSIDQTDHNVLKDQKDRRDQNDPKSFKSGEMMIDPENLTVTPVRLTIINHGTINRGKIGNSETKNPWVKNLLIR